MPRYQIVCTATVHYHVVVEAPNEKAVYDFYDRAGGKEFEEVDCENWDLQGIEELLPDDPGNPKFALNAEGKVIEKP